MIYLDTSVMLARLFAEDRSPPDAFWSQTFVASRLLEFEVFDRIHARAAQATPGAVARQPLALATYDQRLAAAAVSEGFALADC